MGTVDIFLLYVVGFSVIVFLILDWFEETRKGGNKAEESYDDWEGIETTELEKMFGEAVVFVSINGDQSLKSKLHGLHKLALQGPSNESQPTFFNLSPRSNWNAVGEKMSREMAMDKYINILDDAIPHWRTPAHTSS